MFDNTVYFFVDSVNVKYRTEKGIGLVFFPEMLSLNKIPNDCVCWLPKSKVRESVMQDGIIRFDVPLWLVERSGLLMDSVIIRSDDASLELYIRKLINTHKRIGGVLDILSKAEQSAVAGESVLHFSSRFREMLLNKHGGRRM